MYIRVCVCVCVCVISLLCLSVSSEEKMRLIYASMKISALYKINEKIGRILDF